MTKTSKAEPLAAWEPLPGSQTLYLKSPVFEVLYEGTRGNGKTDALLMDFLQEVGRGFGPEWNGVIFRRTYPELDDIRRKAYKWFPLIFPAAKFNIAANTWRFPDGEELSFRHFDRPEDYMSYHGASFPFIGWEELTSWPEDTGYLDMMSCCRSANQGMPRKYRATTNPFGVGHHWCKARFIDPAPASTPIRDEETGQLRVRIHGDIHENTILLRSDPEYISRLRQIKDKAKRDAWISGSWDIAAGGFFDGTWDRDIHVIQPFEIPKGWRVDRAFDWGSSKPFSVLWFAEANGEAVKTLSGREIDVPAGTIFAIAEWYGASAPNTGLKLPSASIAAGIISREDSMISSGMIQTRPFPGPADSAIYTATDGMSIAQTMETHGVRWIPSLKGPGSRVNGWELLRDLLEASKAAPMERSGIFVFDGCRELIKHIPALPRDTRKIDDVDTDAEDHDADALRYRVSTIRHSVETSEAPW